MMIQDFSDCPAGRIGGDNGGVERVGGGGFYSWP